MKKSFLLIIALLFLFDLSFSQTSGGPDAYGYVWRNNSDPSGPSYNWIDITGIGTQISGLADDNSVGPFNLNWDFHFYWTDENQIKIGSNGWISFGNISNIAHCFPRIPQAGGQADNYLAPFMADLNFSGTGNPGQVWFWTNNVDTAIVSYLASPFWVNANPAYTGNNTFQVILSGSDSSVTYQYATMETTFTNTTCAADNESGIENSTGAIGLEVTNESIPLGNTAVKFYYPDSVLVSVKDLTPVWNQNTDNGGVFLPTGLVNLRTNIKNAGNDAINTSTTIDALVLNSLSLQQYNASVNIPAFAAGFDTSITFAPAANLTQAGQYYYNVNCVNGNDINPANNLNSTEIVMVDLSTPGAKLSYATGAANTGTVSWSGGSTSDGAGVYMEPPVYPITLDTLEYYLVSTGSDGYIAAIYDDNGPNGGPGTQLFSQTINSTSITTASWNKVVLPSPITINSGGFYIAWFQGGATIFLGTEDVGPISRRSYEILSNSWATYRENTARDLLIRVSTSGYACAPSASFSSSQSANVVSFNNASSGGSSYLWDFGDGNTSTSVSPTHTYSAAGTYTVCLTSTNVCGSDSACSSVTVTCPLPTPSFTVSQQGISFNFLDQSTGATSWLWDFGDGNTSTAQNPSHTYAVPGTYTVCFTATGVCGSDSSCVSVTPCILPTANFVASAAGATATFSNISSGASSQSWDFGDGNTSAQLSPTHTYNSSGTFTVCLFVNNACGMDTFCSNLSINCATPVSGFSSSANNLTYTFSDLSTGNPTAWLWDFGDGNTSTAQNPAHFYANSGTYTVCMTASNVCGSDSSCTVLSPCAALAANFTFATGATSTLINFSDQSSGNPTSWQWDFGDGNTSIMQNPTHTYAFSDTFTVCLIASSVCASDTICQTVILDPVTGVEAEALHGWTVYPVPAKDLLHIRGEFLAGSRISLSDLSGKILISEEIETIRPKEILNVSGMPAGIYLLEIRGPGFRNVTKVHIQR